MIFTILGIVLLAIPFLLIYRFRNKKMGFVYVLSFVLAFHLMVAIVTQALHIFHYPVIFGIYLIADIIILSRVDFKKLFQDIQGTKLLNYWVLLLLILLFQFFSVHYNYTGQYTTAAGTLREGVHMQYPYPYFSDEWYAVALVQESIDSHKLPLSNPLQARPDAKFMNLELPFHSFVAEIMLLLGLSPLTHYTLLTVFSGLLICFLIYFFLRLNKVDEFPAAVAALSAPFIASSGNLPGLWNLIPMTMGIIAMLLSFTFFSRDKWRMGLLVSPLVIIFYPPFFVIYAVALVSYFLLSKKISLTQKLKSGAVFLAISAIVALFLALIVFLLSGQNFAELFSYISTKILHKAFTAPLVPEFPLYVVVPIPVLILAAIGLVAIVKKKIWLFITLLTGLAYVLVYSGFTIWRFFVEEERIVILTAILLVMVSGFGLNYLVEVLKKVKGVEKYHVLKITSAMVLIAFVILSFNYTDRDNWKAFKLVHPEKNEELLPAAPANRYLHEDDLKLFGRLKGQKFLSTEWKGTVLGVATGNYPVATKAGTISIGSGRFAEFYRADCAGKSALAAKYKIDYVFTPKFECGAFELKGNTGEGFHLYKFVNGTKSPEGVKKEEKANAAGKAEAGN